METVRIYMPRSGQLKLLAMGAALVLGCFWILYGSERGIMGYLIGVVGLAFFGPIFVYLLVGLIYRRPVLQIDARGLTEASTLVSVGFLGWDEVSNMRVITVGSQRMLAITPRDPAAVMARQSGLRRLALRMNRGMGFEAVNVPEQVLPYPLESLIAEIRRHQPAVAVSGLGAPDTDTPVTGLDVSEASLPYCEYVAVIRTDFSDEDAWSVVSSTVEAPNGDDFSANVQLIDDPSYEGLSVTRALALTSDGYEHPIVVLADRWALSDPEMPLLVVDLTEERGRELRVVASQLWAIENNLSRRGTAFHEFADEVADDGVYRGF